MRRSRDWQISILPRKSALYKRNRASVDWLISWNIWLSTVLSTSQERANSWALCPGVRPLV